MKNKLSVRANLSWPSLKEILEKCRQTKNIREQFCAFLKAGKVRGHHPIISYNTLIKHFFHIKTFFLAFFIGLLFQQAAV